MMGTTVVNRRNGVGSQRDQMYIAHVVCDIHDPKVGHVFETLSRKIV